MKRRLLLGAGPAHVQVLQSLAQRPMAGGRVLMVAPFTSLVHAGMVPGLVAGAGDEAVCAVPLAPLARAAGVEFIEASTTALDADARRVTLADGRVAEYDLLSIDPGPAMDRDAIPGAREHGLFFRPAEHFVRMLPAVWALAAARTIDLVVVGGGADAFALAVAFAQRLRALGEGASRVVLVTGGSEPLGDLSTALARRAARTLRLAGVTVLQEACVGVEAGHVLLGNGARVACNAPVLALGTAPPAWLAGSGLALDGRGFVATAPTMQSQSHPQVFAVGDVVDAGAAARAGASLAENLRRAVGGGDLIPHRPRPPALTLLASGDGRALAAWGPWATQGRWVRQWKDRVDRAFVERYRIAVGDGLSPVAGK